VVTVDPAGLIRRWREYQDVAGIAAGLASD
jgi:hypothetical protein